MSLIGKILMVFNVLAAAGFFYLAFLDWGRREAWGDVAAQVELTIVGLPLDEQELDARGNPRVEDMRKPVLSKLFGSSGGIVQTQMSEWERVKKNVQDGIDSQQDPAAKAKRLCRVLKILADTEAEREQVAAEEVKPDLNLQNLQAQLNARFARVLEVVQAPPQPADPAQPPSLSAGTGPKTTGDSRKLLIADHLFRLCEALQDEKTDDPKKTVFDSPAYDRFVKVVGMAMASRAVEHYAQSLQQNILDARDTISQDREKFVREYRLRIATLHTLSEQLKAATTRREEQNALLVVKQGVVGDREKEIEALQEQLKQTRKATEDLVQQQKFVENSLFRARQQLRDAFADNQKLEQILRSTEQDR